MLADRILQTLPPSIRIIRRFSTQALDGALTLQQLRVLNLIREGQGQTQISLTLDVSLAAVSKMITSLEKKRLLQRRSGQDRRTYLLSLTAKGKQLLEKVSLYVKEVLDQQINELSRSEKDQLLEGLKVLDKLMLNLKEV
jgi:DNA-binding MarR family transcriptional regulator